MLTRVHIQNFRSCKDVTIESLGHVVGLVGRNGAGKTTILRALEWVAETALANDMRMGILEPEPAHGSEGVLFDLELSVLDRLYRFKLTRIVHDVGTPVNLGDVESLSVRHGDDGMWQPLFLREGEQVVFGDKRAPVEINTFTPAMPALTALLTRTDPLQAHLRAVMGVLRNVRYYRGHVLVHDPEAMPEEEPSGPISEELYEQWAAANATSHRRTSLLLRLISAHNDRPEVFSELKHFMGPDGLGLLRDIRVLRLGDVDARRSARGRSHRYFDVVFTPGETGVELALNQLSGGTCHALYLLLGLLYDASSTMLVEQPEDGIHPGLLAKLLDILRTNSDPTQVVLTSHSPVVLSSLRPEDVRLVANHGGSTSVRALTAAEVQRAQDYMQRDGTLAEFLEILQES